MQEFTFKNYREQLRKDAQLVPEAVKTIQRVVKLHGPRLVQAQISELVKPPVDRGTYRRSFKFDDTKDGAIAYNFAPYAPIIEFGRRPGMKAPPLAAIEAWIMRKGIGAAQGPRERGPGGRAAVKRRRAQVRALAYVIARQIKRRGLPALLILQHAAHDIDGEIQKAIAVLMSDRLA